VPKGAPISLFRGRRPGESGGRGGEQKTCGEEGGTLYARSIPERAAAVGAKGTERDVTGRPTRLRGTKASELAEKIRGIIAKKYAPKVTSI